MIVGPERQRHRRAQSTPYKDIYSGILGFPPGHAGRPGRLAQDWPVQPIQAYKKDVGGYFLHF